MSPNFWPVALRCKLFKYEIHKDITEFCHLLFQSLLKRAPPFPPCRPPLRPYRPPVPCYRLVWCVSSEPAEPRPPSLVLLANHLSAWPLCSLLCNPSLDLSMEGCLAPPLLVLLFLARWPITLFSEHNVTDLAGRQELGSTSRWKSGSVTTVPWVSLPLFLGVNCIFDLDNWEPVCEVSAGKGGFSCKHWKKQSQFINILSGCKVKIVWKTTDFLTINKNTKILGPNWGFAAKKPNLNWRKCSEAKFRFGQESNLFNCTR